MKIRFWNCTNQKILKIRQNQQKAHLMMCRQMPQQPSPCRIIIHERKRGTCRGPDSTHSDFENRFDASIVDAPRTSSAGRPI